MSETKQMQLETIRLSEIQQSQKDKYISPCVITNPQKMKKVVNRSRRDVLPFGHRVWPLLILPGSLSSILSYFLLARCWCLYLMGCYIPPLYTIEISHWELERGGRGRVWRRCTWETSLSSQVCTAKREMCLLYTDKNMTTITESKKKKKWQHRLLVQGTNAMEI